MTGEEITGILALLAGLVLVFQVVFWFDRRAKAKRLAHASALADAMRVLGAKLGLEFDPFDDESPEDSHPNEFFSQAGRYGMWTHCRLRGTVEAGRRTHAVELGELVYVTSSRNRDHPIRCGYVAMTFDCIGLPSWKLERARGERPGGRDIRVGDRFFDDAYVLTSRDQEETLALLSRDVVNRLAHRPLDPDVRLEFDREHAVVSARGAWDSEQYEKWFRWLVDLYEAFPEHVIAGMPTRAQTERELGKRFGRGGRSPR